MRSYSPCLCLSVSFYKKLSHLICLVSKSITYILVYPGTVESISAYLFDSPINPYYKYY